MVGMAPAAKSLPAATATRMENLPEGAVEARMEVWQRRLAAARSPLPAMDAYCGDAWNQVLEGFAASKVADKALWIASPGLGLIPGRQPLANYSASFSADSVDRIGQNDADSQQWWEALVQWNARQHDLPCGIAELARRHPGATMMLVLNADSLAALHADIWEARENLADPDRLLVIAGGPPACLGLGPSLLRVDTRFERLLGGPRHTVAPRMARHLLEEFTRAELRAPFLQSWLKQMSWRLPAAHTRAKSATLKKLAALELETFVRRELAANPKLKPASLRRMLRESGRTCDAKALEKFFQRYALPLLPD